MTRSIFRARRPGRLRRPAWASAFIFAFLAPAPMQGVAEAESAPGAAAVTAAFDSLEASEESLRAGLFTGAARHLNASASARAAGMGVLEEAAAHPEIILDLPWPLRITWLERAHFEHRPEWGAGLLRALGDALPDPGSPTRGRAAFAIAVTAETLADPEVPGGDPAYGERARRAYAVAAASGDLLRDEAFFRLHLLALAAGDTAAALVHADSLVALAPPSPRSPEVRLLRARRLASLGDAASLGAAVQEAQLAQPAADGVQVRWFLAELYRRLELPRAEALQLEGLIGSYGSTSFGARAFARRIALGEEVPDLYVTRGQRIALLQELLKGPGRTVAEDSLRTWSASSGIAPADRAEATRVLMRHYYRARRYDDAEPLLRRVMAEGSRADADEATLLLARIHRNTGRPGTMTPLYLDLMERDSSEAGNAVWELAREMESLGRWAAAESTYTRLLDLYPRHPRRDQAWFRRGFVRVRLDSLEGAAGDFRSAFAEAGEEGDRERAAYWRARTLRDLGRSEEATRAAAAGMTTARPHDYYGMLLRERFGGADRDESLVGPDLLVPDGPERLAEEGIWPDRALTAFRRGLRFARLGEPGRARVEWRIAADMAGSSPAGRSLLSALAQAATLHDVYPEAVSWARRVQLDFASDDPRRDAYERLFYPAAYFGEVTAEARTRSLPPQLLWGLMRQESFYDPAAVSRAGARGLMQIMPATLERMVRETGFSPGNPDALFRPDVNIRLGTRFLADRIAEFGGRLLPALASYNAGEGKSREWLELAGGDGEEFFVECIGYPETYNYVRRISWLNWVYSRYYDITPPPESPIPR